VKAIPCPAPQFDAQLGVVTQLARIVSHSEGLYRSLRSAELRAARLRKAILAKAFSGQLVPQDPKDEPAGVLLERIRAERGRTMRPARRRREKEQLTVQP
jgi:type I restriction enzyme, S subunit